MMISRNMRVRVIGDAPLRGCRMFWALLWVVVCGCTTYDLPEKENPYDNDASATSVCPEGQPPSVFKTVRAFGVERLIWMIARSV